jgi:UDP-3-O-[3-hydroxymyristoyl] N-acetylglucosamine deacetylase
LIPSNETTLRDAIEASGVGLHTGAPARVRVVPAAAGHGIRFRLDDAVEFPAHISSVVDTRRATVLGWGDRRVSTVEHLLSALVGCGITAALIHVEGPEIPVLDGSAAPWVALIDAVGLVDLGVPRAIFAPDRPSVFREGDKLLAVFPAPDFRVRMMVDFAPPVGTQYADIVVTPERYRLEVAPNRTFGYRREVDALIAAGLAMGGSLENAIVFDEDGPMTPLRRPDEPVWHKVLDLIGDFALLGATPQCEIVAIKSGHALHAQAVRALASFAVA